MDQSYDNHLDTYRVMLESLHECMLACNMCYNACLNEDNVEMMAECIRLNRECADICSFLEKSIASNSPFIADLAQVCAKICGICAEECQRYDMEHCQKCADACFRCEEECNSMMVS